MTFLLTEDQEMLRDTAMAFARDDVSRRRLRSNSKDVAYPLLGSESSSRVFVGPRPPHITRT